MDIDL